MGGSREFSAMVDLVDDVLVLAATITRLLLLVLNQPETEGISPFNDEM